MRRKIPAAILAVCLILLTFGCGKGADKPKTTETNEAAINGKIAVVVGDRSQSPEAYAAAVELVKSNPNAVMLLKYAENFYTDYSAVKNIALTVAENPSVKAILFADGVKGTGEAVQAVREARSDICIVVCDPHEGSVEMTGADLMISVDFPVLGQAMVEQAKKMGAENFLFYTTNRHLKYSSVVALRRAAELACEDEELTFKLASSIDLYDVGRTIESAKKFLYEDVTRKSKTFGEKTALICTEPQLQGSLAGEVIRFGMVMPATFLPSPLSLAADLGVDLTGHETDSAYAMQQLRQESADAVGRVSTWSFSAPVAFVQAAFDYAVGVLNGADTETSIDEVQKLLSAHSAGAAVTVTTDANGAYLVQSDLVTL